jgi:hypothetical protein
MGRKLEALKLREETFAVRKQTLGSDHPSTLAAMELLADGYEGLDRDREALKLREETLALTIKRRGPNHPSTVAALSQVAKSLLKLRRGAEAVPVIRQAVAVAEKLDFSDPNNLYNAGCIHAIAASAFRATENPADAAREADRAMERLKQAIAAGCRDAGHLKNDTDLDSLRGRDDFKKLVAELERHKDQSKR